MEKESHLEEEAEIEAHAEDLETPLMVDLMKDLEDLKCLTQYVINAENHVNCHLNLLQENQYIAAIASEKKIVLIQDLLISTGQKMTLQSC